MLVSVYLGINKKEVSILNEEIKGDKRYEYEVEESIPNKQYMVRRTHPTVLLGSVQCCCKVTVYAITVNRLSCIC